MPFKSQRARLDVSPDVKARLSSISRSRIESAARVERAKMLLAYSEGRTVSAIARMLRTNRPKVERCVDKALQIGALASLSDLPRPGKPHSITDEAKAWLLSLACQKPKALGYSYEFWTTRLLAEHARGHCASAGHPCLKHLSRGTVWKILSKARIKPHKISYYLQRRDPQFDEKMSQVLYVYKEVAMLRAKGKDESSGIAVLSYDEKPGIQAIGNTAPDLAPEPGTRSCFSRDHEYVRFGTVSLLSGIDLLTGEVHAVVADRHRSREFIMFLKMLHKHYRPETTIRIVLDNHSAHTSRETRAFLATVPNRFEFVFTPKHGSWLNLIETFFAKMAKTMLRGIRVSSKRELKQRLLKYIEEVNEAPVIFRWRYGLESISVI